MIIMKQAGPKLINIGNVSCNNKYINKNQFIGSKTYN